MIKFDEPPAHFFELLIPQLVKYGQLEDGRNALEAVLEAAEIFVGQSKKESCESLIQQLRAISSGEEHSSGDPPLHTHRAFRQLLPRPEHFIGRENELADIMLTLQPGSVITLCGPGGIGKTALALETIWRLAEKNELLKRFLDGLIFYSFYGQPDVKLTFEHIVRSFDENASDTKKERVLRLLSRKTVLFVLDGAEEADNLQAVLDVRGNSGVIVTSRPKSDAPDERCDLPPLHAKEAEVLLCAWAGGCAAEDAAIQKICRRVGGLPLAVRLVGRYLNQTGETPAEYLEWLKKHPIEALSPSYAQHRDESVDILLRRSLEQVSPDARQALVIIGQLALAPFAIEPVTAAIDHSDRQIRNALGELVNYSLLERPDERYKVSHALIHNYAHKRVPVAGETVRRLAEYYIDFAKEHSQQDAEGYTRLDAERPHLLKVIENCRRQEEWQAVMNIVWAIGDRDGYLERQGYWTERQTILKMGLEAAQKLSSQEDEGKCLKNLGIAYWQLGQMEHAITYYEQALAIQRNTSYRKGEAQWLRGLGTISRASGEVEQPRQYFRQALTIFEDIKSPQADQVREQLGSATK